MSDRPNILFLMSDEHRADVAGFAGDDVVRTPVRRATAAYYGMIDGIDAHYGRVLAQLRTWDRISTTGSSSTPRTTARCWASTASGRSRSSTRAAAACR